jgi:hypothetical protein
MAWLITLLMVPLILFSWAIDTKKTRINSYRSYGWSWKKIAGIYGVSPTTARRWSMALAVLTVVLFFRIFNPFLPSIICC